MPTLTTLNVGQFCRDLACGIDTIDDVLKDWNLSPQRYNDLRQNPLFQKEMVAAVAEIKDLGPNSSYIMKCRAIAEATLPDVFNIIKNEKVDPGVRMGAYKQVTELGRLGAPKNEGNRDAGPSVVFNFGPGLAGIPETLTIIPTNEPQIQELQVQK